MPLIPPALLKWDFVVSSVERLRRITHSVLVEASLCYGIRIQTFSIKIETRRKKILAIVG